MRGVETKAHLEGVPCGLLMQFQPRNLDKLFADVGGSRNM